MAREHVAFLPHGAGRTRRNPDSSSTALGVSHPRRLAPAYGTHAPSSAGAPLNARQVLPEALQLPPGRAQ